jgi:hypothetical protein
LVIGAEIRNGRAAQVASKPNRKFRRLGWTSGVIALGCREASFIIPGAQRCAGGAVSDKFNFSFTRA